uniref:Uncharacterized protein n=1 Tax=viral metagenome TaxID=1070528 RepID=A0A6H1ZRV2_9ZZZZ
MTLKGNIKKEIEHLLPIRYDLLIDGTWRAIMRDPTTSPTLDQVVDNIITIFAGYHLEQGKEE